MFSMLSEKVSQLRLEAVAQGTNLLARVCQQLAEKMAILERKVLHDLTGQLPARIRQNSWIGGLWQVQQAQKRLAS